MSIRQPAYNFKLTIDGVTYDIDEPKGFAELKSRVVRDKNYHGVFYEMTPEDGLDLGFSGPAKALLRAAFDADGVDSLANINFQVDKVDSPDAEATRIFGDSATTELEWDANTKGFAQKFTLNQLQVLTKARLYFGANAGSPTSTINAYICSVVGTTLTNLSGPINFAVTPSSYTEFEIPYDLEAGDYAIKFVSANDGTLDATNYYTLYVENPGNNNLLYSTDSGSTWAPGLVDESNGWEEIGTDSLPIPLYGNVVVAFDDGGGEKMWSIGGITTGPTKTRKVYSSADGITWTEAGTDALPIPLAYTQVLVFDDGGGEKMFTIGGQTTVGRTRKVYSSPDGINWTEVGADAVPVALYQHQAVVFNDGSGNKMWIIGGATTTYQQKVYSSPTGATWTEAGTNSLPYGVYGHTSVVFDDGSGNEMYLIGGIISTGDTTRKVYSSPDGINWTEKGTDALPVARNMHASFVQYSKIWVLGGGEISNDFTKTIYKSSDGGATWTLHNHYLLKEVRQFSALVYNGAPWVVGGLISSVGTEKVYSATVSSYDLKSGVTLEPHVQTLYLGNVDFSHATEDQDYINVKILKSDVLIDVLNNRDIKINIADSTALDGTTVYGKTLERVFMDAFPINRQWSGKNGETGMLQLFDQTAANMYVTWNPYIILSDEIDETNPLGINEMITALQPDNADSIWIVDQYVGAAEIHIDYTIIYGLGVFHTSGSPETYTISLSLYISIYNSSDVLQHTHIKTIEQKSGTLASSDSVSLDGGYALGTFTCDDWTLNNGDYIKTYFVFVVSGTLATEATRKFAFQLQPIIIINQIRISTVQPYSVIEGLKVYDALDGAIQVMTGLQNSLVSNLFDTGGCGHNTFITNGWNVRNFEDKPITTSFKHLFDGLQAIFGLGYGIENGKVRIELWEHFYQNAQLIDLGVTGIVDEGKVGDYREEVMGDMIFNKIVLGFENYANDEKMSDTIYDFHTISEWNTPIKNHKGEFRQVSSLILSPYLIESTRRVQFLNKPTESFRWDDHLFMLAIEDYYDSSLAEYQIETNETITTTGIPYPSDIPNLRYTIKRMLLNWGVWINSFAMRYKEVTEAVKNTFFKNNGSLVTQFSESEDCLLGDLDRASLTENADITKAEIQNGTALFDQVFIHFRRKLSDEELDTIKSAHDGTGDDYLVPLYGYIKLRNTKGEIVSGWLMDMTYNIFDQVADITLIKRYVAGETTEPDIPVPEGLVIAIGSYSNVGQRFSIAAGTLVSIKVTVQTAGGTVNVYIAPVLWDGLPDTSNKIYDSNVTLAVGENTIPLNLVIATGGVYMIVFEYLSTTVYLTTVDQTGYFVEQTDQYLARQINDGDWQAPSEQYPVKYFVNSIPTLTPNRYWFSSGVSYTDLFHYIDRDNYQYIANTIQFLSDVQVKSLKFYVTKSGSPTAVLQGAIYSLDANDKPDAGICYTASITPVNGVNSKDFTLGTTTLTKGRYAVVISAAVSGTLDSSNKYIIRATSNQDVFRAGVMYKKGAQTSNLWLEYSYDLVFELTYEKV